MVFTKVCDVKIIEGCLANEAEINLLRQLNYSSEHTVYH